MIFINIMKISSITPACYTSNIYHPNFQGNRRFVYDKGGIFLYRTTTYFFRDDLNWNTFINLIWDKYKNVDRVNVINHVCSNGQEPYSLATMLMEKLGEEAEKFFPIIAKDVDEDNINSAKNGRLGIKNEDLYRINHFINDNISEYFDKGRAINPENDLVLIPKTKLRNSVIFSQSDIFEDIKTIPSSNTILMCRNFWPYLEPQKRKQLAVEIAKKLDSTSLLVTGNYDFCSIVDLFKALGLVQTGVRNVYTLKDKFKLFFKTH